MHEPYEARRFEREEKKGSVHYGWRSFRACPQRESDSWPSVPETDALSTELQGRGVVSRLGGRLTSCMSGTTNVESSVEGKSIRRAAAKLLLLVSNQDYGFQRPVCCRYTKEECARTHRTRMPDCVPPCRSNPFFADWIPGPIPWPITADRLADGARVELARDFRPNSLSRTAPLPHGPPSMPVFSVRGTPAKPR